MDAGRAHRQHGCHCSIGMPALQRAPPDYHGSMLVAVVELGGTSRRAAPGATRTRCGARRIACWGWRWRTWTATARIGGARCRSFNGPEPVVQVCDDAEAEAAAVAEWLGARIGGGLRPDEVGVFARSDAELARAPRPPPDHWHCPRQRVPGRPERAALNVHSSVRARSFSRWRRRRGCRWRA